MIHIILICIFGLVAIIYGMIRDNDYLFILGVLFVIAGYLYLDNGRMGGSNADDGKYQQQKQGHQQHVAIGIGF